MPEISARKSAEAGKGNCLAISLQPAASHLRASDGREISFTRAILTMRNVCDEELTSVIPHATLGQEGGTVQDVSGPLSPAGPVSIPARGTITWDVYDILLPAHPGTSSKVHMFGYRAALNWRFDLAVWAESRLSSGGAPAQTPVSRWSLRWSVVDTATGAVDASIESA